MNPIEKIGPLCEVSEKNNNKRPTNGRTDGQADGRTYERQSEFESEAKTQQTNKTIKEKTKFRLLSCMTVVHSLFFRACVSCLCVLHFRHTFNYPWVTTQKPIRASWLPCIPTSLPPHPLSFQLLSTSMRVTNASASHLTSSMLTFHDNH